MQDPTDRLFAYYSKQSHSRPSRLISIEEFIDFTIEGRYRKNPELIRASGLPKNDKLYLEKKAEQPHIMFGAEPHPKNKDIIFLKSLSGYIYLDFDDFSAVSFSEMRKVLLKFDFIVGIWLSFGGKGYGALAYCPQLKNMPIDAYRQCYEQMSDYIGRNAGIRIKTDSSCKNPNRQTAMSSDFMAEFRMDYRGFEFNYKPEETKKRESYKGKAGDRYKGIELDSELKITREHLLEFDFLLEKYIYTPYIVLDAGTGLPVKYNEERLSTDGDYELVRYLDKQVIGNIPIKNETRTMAYLPEGFHRMVLKLSEETYIPFGRRAVTMKAVALSLLAIRKMTEGLLHTKTEVYHILYHLNKKCVLRLPKSIELKESIFTEYEMLEPKGKSHLQVDFLPLDDEELNRLTTLVWNIYQSDDYNLNTKDGKIVMSDDFYLSKERETGNKCRSKSEKASARRSEINRLLGMHKRERSMAVLEEMNRLNPGMTYTAAVNEVLRRSEESKGETKDKVISKRTAEIQIRRFRGKWTERFLEEERSVLENSGTAIPYPSMYFDNRFRYYPFSGGRLTEDCIHPNTPTTAADGDMVLRDSIRQAIDAIYKEGMVIRQKDVAMRIGIRPNRLSAHWGQFKNIVRKRNDKTAGKKKKSNSRKPATQHARATRAAKTSACKDCRTTALAITASLLTDITN